MLRFRQRAPARRLDGNRGDGGRRPLCRAVHTLDAGVRFFPRGVSALVPLIESDQPRRRDDCRVREYAALKEAEADTVILGCTHYPLIQPIFERVFGRDVTLVFPPRRPPERLRRRWRGRDRERR